MELPKTWRGSTLVCLRVRPSYRAAYTHGLLIRQHVHSADTSHVSLTLPRQKGKIKRISRVVRPRRGCRVGVQTAAVLGTYEMKIHLCFQVGFCDFTSPHKSDLRDQPRPALLGFFTIFSRALHAVPPHQKTNHPHCTVRAKSSGIEI